jgi:hypothetical protein
MILLNSQVFVGEFNSNWGRLVRLFRTSLLEEESGGRNDLKMKAGSKGAASNLPQTQQHR